MNSIEIGLLIKKYRKEKKLTQQQLAEALNKTEGTIRKYEKGTIKVPIELLSEISKIVEVNLLHLIGSPVTVYGSVSLTGSGSLVSKGHVIKGPYSLFKDYLKAEYKNIYDEFEEKQLEEIYVNASEYIECKIYKMKTNEKVEENKG